MLNEDGEPDILSRILPEYQFFSRDENTKGEYFSYSAHSCLGERRIFYPSLNNSNSQQRISNNEFPTIQECFISDLLRPTEKITLYIQQAEEFDRCVAGIKAFFMLIPPDLTKERTRGGKERDLASILNIHGNVNFCDKIGLRIFEIDSAPGILPTIFDSSSKYVNLLVDIAIDDFKDVIIALRNSISFQQEMDIIHSQLVRGISFRKISTCKYFAIELTNNGDTPGQVVIHSLQLMRSAHVSLQPKPAKAQQANSLHYRIIGPDLADDFSKLGNGGFSFSIEKVTAGQTKNVLFSAMSLLDLLHTGGARVHSNTRRRAAEFEMTEDFMEPKEPDGSEKIYNKKNCFRLFGLPFCIYTAKFRREGNRE